MTITTHMCKQFNKNCAVCPVKTSYITRFCEHHFECKIRRNVKRKIHDYSEDIRIANELINKFSWVSDGVINAYDELDMTNQLTDEQREYALKVLL